MRAFHFSINKHLLPLVVLCTMAFYLFNCGGDNNAKEDIKEGVSESTPTITLSSDVPHDVQASNGPFPTGADSVSLTALAAFAWQEFIALNYPADPNNRGKAKAGANFGDAADARVWETYWHKVEMFPYNEAPNASAGKPATTGKPNYQYDPSAFKFAGNNANGVSEADSTLWNNLDETNELNVDKMYAHQVDAEHQILYQAKMNETGFQYVLDQELYKTATRNTKTAATIANIDKYGAQCTQVDSIVCLPCGTNGGSEGNIEIKSAWRKLTSGEDTSKYYTNSVIYYKFNKNTQTRNWYTETYALIGLHIIHKTANFPAFVYATFEHNDNLSSDLYYIDEITQNSRGCADTAGDTVAITKRDNPIPSEITKANTAAAAVVAGTVFENYQLIGVQAYPLDYSELNDSDVTEKSTYYLSNLVIESNCELQNFRGTKAANGADIDNMYAKGRQLNMGGCMGCHGVSELSKGGDFNFLITNGPFTSPEIIDDEGIVNLMDINNYADVQQMFNDYVKFNGIHISGSPHLSFWDSLTYDQFITMDAPIPSYYGKVKICNCCDSKNSAIVQILEHSINSSTDVNIEEMPAGGPYFPMEQIEKFATWIDNGCPNNGTKVNCN